MQLNLGCGLDIRGEMINVDVRRNPRVNVLADITVLPFRESVIDKVLALDVVEHVSWKRVMRVMREIRRILSSSGVARIRVPDLDELVAMRNNGALTDSELVRKIFGGQEYPDDTHRAGFTRKVARTLFSAAGLKVVSESAFNGNVTWIVNRMGS